MENPVVFIILTVLIENVFGVYYLNYTGDAAGRQLYDFKQEHPVPLGLLTTTHGEPVEIRSTVSVNTDAFSNQHNLDLQFHLDAERIPERVVHAKGIGAYGYFEVTHDVSKYTSAEVFNGVGKKTPLVARLSLSRSNLGISDLGHELRGLAVKFYTKEGNLDLLCLQTPIYVYRDAVNFPAFARARRRNPRTNMVDRTATWDFVTLRPITLHALLWLNSDYGSPRGYRRMDAFPIHTYEVSNKHGERHYVKFNFRTEQGLANFTAAENKVISGEDPDYFMRDVYNAISEKDYPSWRLDMDVMTVKNTKNIDYNPFDVTRQWKKGTYHTVTIGRMVLNQRVENNFKDVELSAYNPGNLVPGIPGPVDFLFKARRFTYRDTQNYRLGRNHIKIDVNMPKYAKTYTRDSAAPVRDNMKDTPNYYPNTFNGPIPYVDETRPWEKLLVLESTAVDLEPASDFYNNVVESDAHRQRIINNVAESLLPVVPSVARRGLQLLTMTDGHLGKSVALRLRQLKAAALRETTEERYTRLAGCFESTMEKSLRKY